MGLAKPALHFLALEHKRQPFTGTVLLLGRQGVFATLAECRELLRREGLTPYELEADDDHSTNIPYWRGTDKGRFTSDVTFFRLLGVRECPALDCSDFEGAEIIWNLNDPSPEHLAGKFDAILDAGTLEHVFDVKQALCNLTAMLKPGGRIIHMTPANNFCNHGFYQISPTLFADYYRANLFDDLRIYVVDERRAGDQTKYFDLFAMNVEQQPAIMLSHARWRMLTICVAVKSVASTGKEMPIQSYYQEAHQHAGAWSGASGASERAPTMWFNRWAWHMLPRSWYRWARAGWIGVRQRVLDQRQQWRPWGLCHWRRLR